VLIGEGGEKSGTQFRWRRGLRFMCQRKADSGGVWSHCNGVVGACSVKGLTIVVQVRSK
jgi:hypothetical protein